MSRQVILKAITLKGRNRIQEHGILWDVVEEEGINSGDKILLCSTATKYLKWGPAPDFEIVEESK